jgi:hypothetical protein
LLRLLSFDRIDNGPSKQAVLKAVRLRGPMVQNHRERANGNGSSKQDSINHRESQQAANCRDNVDERLRPAIIRPDQNAVRYQQ